MGQFFFWWDVHFVVEAAEKVEEEHGLGAKQEDDNFWIVALTEEHLEVVYEDDAELNLKEYEIRKKIQAWKCVGGS